MQCAAFTSLDVAFISHLTQLFLHGGYIDTRFPTQSFQSNIGIILHSGKQFACRAASEDNTLTIIPPYIW